MPLQRVLEPESMESVEEALAYDRMDHAEVNRIFVDDLLAWGGIRGEVLDLGTGTAQIPIELCRRNPDVCVLGVDVSQEMLRIARENVERCGFADRVLLDCADSKRLSYDDGRFDVVMSNSLLHHIPDPLIAMAEMVRTVAAGGLIFVRDLLRPESDEEVWCLVDRYAGRESEHGRRMFEDSLRAALDLSEIRALVQRLNDGDSSVRRTSDRHWTWSMKVWR